MRTRARTSWWACSGEAQARVATPLGDAPWAVSERVNCRRERGHPFPCDAGCGASGARSASASPSSAAACPWSASFTCTARRWRCTRGTTPNSSTRGMGRCSWQRPSASPGTSTAPPRSPSSPAWGRGITTGETQAGSAWQLPPRAGDCPASKRCPFGTTPSQETRVRAGGALHGQAPGRGARVAAEAHRACGCQAQLVVRCRCCAVQGVRAITRQEAGTMVKSRWVHTRLHKTGYLSLEAHIMRRPGPSPDSPAMAEGRRDEAGSQRARRERTLRRE